MELHGVDVSHYQGTIDWQAVKAAGAVKFAILKIGYGWYANQIDPKFAQNYKGVKAAGIPIGGYWYSHAVTAEQGKKEAATCLKAIEGLQFEWPIYYDYEANKDTNGGTKAGRTAACVAFCEAMEKAGYYTGVYSFTNFFRSNLDWQSLSKRFSIWLADYRANYDKEIPRDIHQYKSTGLEVGIPARVDCNTAYKDMAVIIKAAGLNGWGKASLQTFTAQASAGDIARLKALAESLNLSYKIE